MKKTTCFKCGCKHAYDFVFKILCPNKHCINYDPKLSKENDTADLIADDNGDCWIDELFLDMD